jgi:spoIIIJ-associated protein
MSSTVRVEGSSLEDALRAAVQDLLDEDDIEVEVRGPGVETWTGKVRLDLLVASGEEEPPGDERDDAAPAKSEERDEAPAQPAREEFVLPTAEELDDEADAAADFLEGLLDAMDLPGDLRIKLHDDHVEVEVIEIGNGALIGRRGQTLDAIQELIRCSLQRQFQRRSRVKVDAEGYRARRMEKLLEKADEAIDLALDTGEPQRLEPMDVFERKAVHHLVAEVDGLVSRSQGREPSRRVVIEVE